MLILAANTNRKLQLVTASGGADIEVSGSYMEADTSSPPAITDIGEIILASITTALTTDVLAGAASKKRNIKELVTRNNHASASETVTWQITDGTSTDTKMKCVLLAGEVLVLTETGVWLHYDSNGALYPSVGNAASQAEMEAGTAADKYVTPQGVNWHPGAAKCWGKAAGAGTTLHANWNIASIADTGTGRLGWTIGTDFSGTHWAALTSLQRVATSLAVANVDIGGGLFRNAGQTAAVIESENYDETATTNVAQDPEFYYMAGFGDQ